MGISFINKGGGTRGGVKLFPTQAEMQADKYAKEGDLALVYGTEIGNMTATTQTQYITFPETVTLLEAFETSTYARLRAVDSSVMFDGNVSLNKTSFRFGGYSESGMIRVEYTSTDGITYTRNTFEGDSGELTNPVDVGTVIKCDTHDQWNEALGYFMQALISNFGGVFNYTTYISELDIKPVDLSTLKYSQDTGLSAELGNNIVSFDTIKPVLDKINIEKAINYIIAYDGVDWYVLPYYKPASYDMQYYDYKNNKLYHTFVANSITNGSVDPDAKIYKVSKDLSTVEVILQSTLTEPILSWGANPKTYNKIIEIPLTAEAFIGAYNKNNNTLDDSISIYYGNGINTGTPISTSKRLAYEYVSKYAYIPAPTQLTATDTDVAQGKEFYGKNGVQTGTYARATSA